MIQAKKRPAEKNASEGQPVKKQKATDDGKKQKFQGKKPFNKFGAKGKKFQKDFKPKGQQFKTKADGKTDWADVKLKKKDLRAQRKKQKAKDASLYELSVQAKQLYEKLKCKTTPNKHELCTELHSLLKKGDAYAKLVLSHDIARVVQCLLKYSQGEIRKEISEILLPNIVQMSTSKYAHFCVSRMLKYGTKEIRSKVITGFFGNIIKLVSHKFSNELVDIAYNTHATPTEKAEIRQEFYSDLYRKNKAKNVQTLEDTWKDSPELKTAVMASTKANLMKCANKELVDNGLVHAVLLEFMKVCAETDQQDVVQAYSGLLAHLSSTKEGAHAAIECYLKAQTKDRRAILKSLKEHVEKICKHEFGHLLMITIINCTDDTVMLSKTIFNVIISRLESIASNEWGRKVLEWTVAPTDTAFFHPQFVTEMNAGLKHSKKDADVRQKEIFAIVEKPFTEAIAKNASFWLRGGSTALLTCAIMRKAKGEHSKGAYEALADVVSDAEWRVNETENDEEAEETEKVAQIPSIKIKKIKKNPLIDENEEKKEEKQIAGIEHPGLHVALKKLIKSDQAKEDEDTSNRFGTALVAKLTKETVEKWLPLNRACFILLNLYETNDESVQSQIKELLNKAALKKQQHSGAKILLKKLF
ncbi:protein penguin [Culicoides brevitarsis]|uniref:protein penguin n=1 Tax=Culicoides brevitarsis TaxID=469753 RepID=UPI00307CA5BF